MPQVTANLQPTAAAVRGIVSCSGTAYKNVYDFLDYVLNPGMQKQRSYLKGTKHFLQWIEKLRDYKTLYVTMPDKFILPAITEYLESRPLRKP